MWVVPGTALWRARGEESNRPPEEVKRSVRRPGRVAVTAPHPCSVVEPVFVAWVWGRIPLRSSVSTYFRRSFNDSVEEVDALRRIGWRFQRLVSL